MLCFSFQGDGSVGTGSRLRVGRARARWSVCHNQECTRLIAAMLLVADAARKIPVSLQIAGMSLGFKTEVLKRRRSLCFISESVIGWFYPLVNTWVIGLCFGLFPNTGPQYSNSMNSLI